MKGKDIRWIQRLSNYVKVLEQLNDAVKLTNERNLSKLEQQGLIQSFEYTHELAWQVMKDFFIYQGNPDIMGSRDATREAFANGLIEEGEIWMDMIKSRNLTSHTYNEEIASDIAQKIVDDYIHVFNMFSTTMKTIEADQQ
ncbi:MAG: nucleotidyltransferase substrate binding protein [Bacteroidetes bacterium]|nr:nucleotidyltransferase substrate binding protein [Bacteroidota bacterium]MCH8525291.1 nucleotidyltransferase substrate binding protein [Balneolales bacterium]